MYIGTTVYMRIKTGFLQCTRVQTRQVSQNVGLGTDLYTATTVNLQSNQVSHNVPTGTHLFRFLRM
jgi:hypothetical protein